MKTYRKSTLFVSSFVRFLFQHCCIIHTFFSTLFLSCFVRFLFQQFCIIPTLFSTLFVSCFVRFLFRHCCIIITYFYRLSFLLSFHVWENVQRQRVVVVVVVAASHTVCNKLGNKAPSGGLSLKKVFPSPFRTPRCKHGENIGIRMV